jgi:hypothetical protein
MGSYYQSIVFPDVPREAAEQGGREILNCLQESGIVESELTGLDVWARNNGSHPLLCQGCNVSSEMTFWTTWHPEFVDDPPFAVSYLGLTFWNWPELARPRFDGFGVKLGSRVVYQYRKL